MDTEEKDQAKPVRILLGRRASEALTAAGNAAFVVIGKASWPDDPERLAIHLIPCPIEAGNAAVAVARGEKRAVKQRKAKARPTRAREAGTKSGGADKSEKGDRT